LKTSVSTTTRESGVQDIPIAVSLNFDSLNEAYGFPEGYTDPAFFRAFDRLQGLADKYGIPLSIYVIGRDLEKPEHFQRVREWQAKGHEIGNHSWSHFHNLGTRSPEVIHDEIKRSHDLISECTGSEPVGFITPSWSTSKRVVQTLIDLGYDYDHSVFPSFMFYAVVGRDALNHIGHPERFLRLLRRRDWLNPWYRPARPFWVDSRFRRVAASRTAENERLLVLPMPTAHRFSFTCWHTVGFFLGWNRLHGLIDDLLDHHECFYYLFHPADFIGPEDLDNDSSLYLARMDVPLTEKMKRLEEVFERLASHGRPLTTMSKLAEFHRQRTR